MNFLLHGHLARQGHSRRQVHVRSDVAVVIHRHARVQNAVRRQSRPGLHHRPGEHLHPVREDDIGREDRRGVNDRLKFETRGAPDFVEFPPPRGRGHRAQSVHQANFGGRVPSQDLIATQPADTPEAGCVWIRIGKTQDTSPQQQQCIDQHPRMPAPAQHKKPPLH
jgi:hypothetical protein